MGRLVFSYVCFGGNICCCRVVWIGHKISNVFPVRVSWLKNIKYFHLVNFDNKVFRWFYTTILLGSVVSRRVRI